MKTNALDNKTILIAEDDEMSFRYLDMIITSRAPVSVIWAINGQLAVEYCKRYSHIDLVLMDLHLPVLDGLEALKQIKAFRPGLPVLIHTATSYGDESEQCIRAGCDGFITKPVSFNELLYRIGLLLDPVTAR